VARAHVPRHTAAKPRRAAEFAELEIFIQMTGYERT
jgi:hypothetical protein